MDKEQRDSYTESTSHKSLLNHYKGVTQRLCFDSTGRTTETAYCILSLNTGSLSHGKLASARNLECFQTLLRIEFQTENVFKFPAEGGFLSSETAVNTVKIKCAIGRVICSRLIKRRGAAFKELHHEHSYAQWRNLEEQGGGTYPHFNIFSK